MESVFANIRQEYSSVRQRQLDDICGAPMPALLMDHSEIRPFRNAAKQEGINWS